ncbi:MAG TPA: TlpA disulfide reductase family protein, partial [Myxococcales bacterium]
GEPAPLFSGSVQNPDAAGVQAVDLGALLRPGARPAARAVLISFFSSACESCSKELPVLQTLSTAYAERGLRVISVALDRDEAAAQRTARLLRESGVTFPVIDDRDRRIARQYLGSTLQLPSLFIVDGEGKVVVAKKGYTDDPATFLPAQVAAAVK